MLSDKENENKVKKYADENNFTIIANKLGSLEYVKYCSVETSVIEFLKWPKGADEMSLTRKGIVKKIKIVSLEK